METTNLIDNQVVVGNDVGKWGTLRNRPTVINFIAESIYKRDRQRQETNKEKKRAE